jgi:hypothetical protein
VLLQQQPKHNFVVAGTAMRWQRLRANKEFFRTTSKVAFIENKKPFISIS